MSAVASQGSVAATSHTFGGGLVVARNSTLAASAAMS